MLGPLSLLPLHEHSVKSVRIRIYSGPYFPKFGLNTERYEVFSQIRTAYGEIRSILDI